MERRWLVFAGLLVLLTLVWGRVERFERVGAWIAQGGPVDEAHGWSVSSRGARVTPLPDGVRIELVGPDCEQDRGCRATITKAGAVGPPGLARTTAHASWSGVQRGVPHTFGLHGSVREVLDSGAVGAGWPLRDQRRTGSSVPVLVEGVSRLEQSSERWEVWWTLSGVRGTAELRDIRASAVQTRALWSVGVGVLALGWWVWTCTGLWVLWCESKRKRLSILTTLLIGGVLIGTLTPDMVLDPVRKPLQSSIYSTLDSVRQFVIPQASMEVAVRKEEAPSTSVQRLAPSAAVKHTSLARGESTEAGVVSRLVLLVLNVDKLGHLLFFAALSITSLQCVPQHRRRTLVLSIVLLAVGTELLQGFTLDRTARWLDVVIDTVGLALGYLGLLLLARFGIVRLEVEQEAVPE